MSGIPHHQAPSSVCNDEEYNCKHQDGRHVLILVLLWRMPASNLGVSSPFS
jgi:hypothetical protein